MKKSKYVKPQIEIVCTHMVGKLLADSWGTDGNTTRIIEGDPEGPVDAKEDNNSPGGYDPWGTWDE